MKKYFQIFKLNCQEYFTYRLSFVLWRVRTFFSFLTLLFFWLAVFAGKDNFAGYQRAQMLTYVVAVAFLRGLIFSTRTTALASWIREGGLNSVLLRPISVNKFLLSRDFADKLLNFVFVLFEIILVMKVFSFSIVFPDNWLTAAVSIIFILFSFCLYFFLSTTISLTAFWTDDIWAVRFLFGVIFLDFLSGAFFPLDFLPLWLKSALAFTPFPYLVYYPIKVWLNQIPILKAGQAMAICFLWLCFFVWLAKWLWNKGFKEYGAYGG